MDQRKNGLVGVMGCRRKAWDRRDGGAPTGCDDDPRCCDAVLADCHRVVGDEPGPILDERRAVLRENLGALSGRDAFDRGANRVMASPKEAPLRADEAVSWRAHSR